MWTPIRWTMDDKVRWLRNLGREPYRLGKTVRGTVWEFISYPFAEGDRVDIMVRVPGDPTTIRQVDAIVVHPESATLRYGAEDGREFYYRDSAWMAERRAADIAEWEAPR